MKKPGLCRNDMQIHATEESSWGAGKQMTKGQIRSLDHKKGVIIFDASVKKTFPASVWSRMLALGQELTNDSQLGAK